jgi:probable HAF family extracellular repeat protein
VGTVIAWALMRSCSAEARDATLGQLGTDYSFGFAINNSGQGAGNYSKVIDVNGNATGRIFLHSRGKTIDIGDLGGGFAAVIGPSAINKHGQIVGVSTFAANSGLAHAFLYTPDKGMVDLNRVIPKRLKVTLTEARGINNRGQIIAIDRDFRSFLLTPKKQKKHTANDENDSDQESGDETNESQ